MFSAVGARAQVQDGWPDNPVVSRPGQDCRNLSVLVRERNGLGISGATVRVEGVWEATTDSDGIAVFDCRHIGHFPGMVEVTASGYQPARVPIDPLSNQPETVELDRAGPPMPYAGNKVDEKELSPEVQEKSAHLQAEASKALAAHDYETAQGLLLAALRLTPSSPAIYNNLGVTSLHYHDIETAATWFEKAVRASPYDPSLAGNLGLVRWLQHRAEESYTLLLRANDLGYQSAAGHYVLGLMSLQRGFPQKAVEHLKKIPQEKFSYRDLYLSIALRACGKTRAAQESYQNFLRRNPVGYVSVNTVN